MTTTTNTTNNTTTNTTEENTMTKTHATVNTISAEYDNTNMHIDIHMFNRAIVFATCDCMVDGEAKRAMLFSYIDSDGVDHTHTITFDSLAKALDYMIDHIVKAFNWCKDQVMAFYNYIQKKFFSKKEEDKKEEKKDK